MNATGSQDLSLWFADGTNFQDKPTFVNVRRGCMMLRRSISSLAPDQRMLIEYKFFEPSFYHTDLADWGRLIYLLLNWASGSVLIDLGHHHKVPISNSLWPT